METGTALRPESVGERHAAGAAEHVESVAALSAQVACLQRLVSELLLKNERLRQALEGVA